MDLVAELMKLDWSYTHKDGKNFINNEKAFDESSTFKIINGKFNSPFCKVIEVPYKTRCKVPIPSNVEAEPKNPEDFHHKGEYTQIPLYPEKSLLKPQEHELGLRVLIQYLKNGPVISSHAMPVHDVTNAGVNKLAKKLTPKINRERQLFATHVQRVWMAKHCSRQLNINQGHQQYIEEIWKEKIDAIIPKYPQYYQYTGMVPLVSQAGEPVNLEEIRTLKSKMYYGPKLYVPNLETIHFGLSKNYHVIKRKHINLPDETKFTVNDDETCERLAVENIANIVLSPDCLRCIVNNIAPYCKTWNIPFTVKEYQLKDPKGKLIHHTVVYMDPPLPPQNLTTKEKNEWAHSTLLKNAMLRDVTHKSNNISYVETKCDYCKAKNSVSPGPSKSPTSPVGNKNDLDDTADSLHGELESSDDEDKLIMDIDESVLSQSSEPEITGVVTRSRASASLAALQLQPEVVQSAKKRKLEVDKCSCVKKKMSLNTHTNHPLTEDNFSYNLWKLHQSSEVNVLSKLSKKEILILVRSKGDGYMEYQGDKRTCILEPKLEYQFEYGYEVTTPEEAATQWTSLHFVPDSQLIRGRVHAHHSELLMLEKYDSKTFSAELAKQTMWTPSKAKCALFDVFTQLSQCRAGQYLLSHQEKHGAFAVVYVNTPQRCENGIDLKEIFTIDMSDIGLKQSAPWTPIDCNLPTKVHIKHNIMPCMFNPKANRFIATKETPKKKKLKTKKEKLKALRSAKKKPKAS